MPPLAHILLTYKSKKEIAESFYFEEHNGVGWYMQTSAPIRFAAGILPQIRKILRDLLTVTYLMVS
jgi:hypothetical protein